MKRLARTLAEASCFSKHCCSRSGEVEQRLALIARNMTEAERFNAVLTKDATLRGLKERLLFRGLHSQLSQACGTNLCSASCLRLATL